MPRRREVPERVIVPDAKYNSKLVSKFIKSIMKDGNRITSYNVCYTKLLRCSSFKTFQCRPLVRRYIMNNQRIDIHIRILISICHSAFDCFFNVV